MSRRRCVQSWYGACPTPANLGQLIDNPTHRCARPPGHPAPCMCYCGDRPAPDGQQPLWAGAA
jgi:hypothetical protein